MHDNDPDAPHVAVTIVSFGRMRLVQPKNADIQLDVRNTLPGPELIPRLEHLAGTDELVYQHVLQTAGAQEVVAGLVASVTALRAARLRNAHDVTLCVENVLVTIGDDLGRHRSVALAQALGRALDALGIETIVEHPDVTEPPVSEGMRPIAELRALLNETAATIEGAVALGSYQAAAVQLQDFEARHVLTLVADLVEGGQAVMGPLLTRLQLGEVAGLELTEVQQRLLRCARAIAKHSAPHRLDGLPASLLKHAVG